MSATHHSHKSDRIAVLHLDRLLDEALEETFPASDPVAVTVEPNLPRPQAESRATGVAVARRERGHR